MKTRTPMLAVQGMQICRKLGKGAYTLIELVGVLAIIAILGLIVTENVLEKIKRQARKTEGDNLATMADAMRRSVVRTKSIPGAGNMPARIAEELSLPVSKLLTTQFRQTRYFFMHPDFRVGTNLTSTLPYTQTVLGSTREPTNCQALIISSVGPLEEDLIPAEMDGATFTNLWNTSEDWDALARDVKLQRIEFRDLFHRIVLNNLDSTRNAPFSVESTNTLTSIAPGGRFETWFIDTTALNLHMVVGTGVQLQTREIIREDVSYVFENGRWARYLGGGRGAGGGDFGSLVDAFL
ncbi:MAG: type II secretion system protein, partial [Verrucomicrobiia bacterium]